MKPPKGMEVDHKDGDGLNCTRGNMRVCTSSQNKANKIKQSNGITSQYKGVNWFRYDPLRYAKVGRWRMEICFEGKRISKYFDTEIEAAKAYNKYALELFGEFALLNDV